MKYPYSRPNNIYTLSQLIVPITEGTQVPAAVEPFLTINNSLVGPTKVVYGTNQMPYYGTRAMTNDPGPKFALMPT